MSTVLVTGASSGIGRATALELARTGDRVFAGVRSSDGAEQLRADAAAAGVAMDVIRLDVTDAQSTTDAVQYVLNAAQRIDALANVAGQSHYAAVEELSDHDSRVVFETNFFGPLRLIREVLPVMRSQGHGRVVNVSSAAGVAPRSYLAVYSASKHALDALSFALDAEVHAFGVRVCVVSPGRFHTRANVNRLGPTQDSGVSRYRAIAMKKFARRQVESAGGDPIEVARVISSCIHDESPPARTFVGDDAKELSALRRRISDDDYAAWLLRDLADLE